MLQTSQYSSSTDHAELMYNPYKSKTVISCGKTKKMTALASHNSFNVNNFNF